MSSSLVLLASSHLQEHCSEVHLSVAPYVGQSSTEPSVGPGGGAQLWDPRVTAEEDLEVKAWSDLTIPCAKIFSDTRKPPQEVHFRDP